MKSRLRIISGHGGQDPGAINGELIERDRNRDAVLSFNDWMLRTYAPPAGQVEVIVVPAEDPRKGTPLLLDKIADANAAGEDQLLIEVHHNVAAPGNGAQIWYYITKARLGAAPFPGTILFDYDYLLDADGAASKLLGGAFEVSKGAWFNTERVAAVRHRLVKNATALANDPRVFTVIQREATLVG